MGKDIRVNRMFFSAQLCKLPSQCWYFDWQFAQSRAQSYSGSLSAVGRREKLWNNGIFVPEIVGHRL